MYCTRKAVYNKYVRGATQKFGEFAHKKLHIYIYIHTLYTRPLSVQAGNSRSCPVLSSSRYNGSLVTWTVVLLTAAKFKPLVFSVPGFAMSNIANICILCALENCQWCGEPCFAVCNAWSFTFVPLYMSLLHGAWTQGNLTFCSM
jgi:hypothetical protein